MRKTFHEGLTKKQFLTLGYAYLSNKQGIPPTCRNVRALMEKHEAFKENPKSLEYNNIRSTFTKLELMYEVVKGSPVMSTFMPSCGKPPNAFIPTKRGMEILRSYLGVKEEIGQHN